MKHFILHIILLALVLTVSPAHPWHSLGSGPVLTVEWNKKANMPGPLYAFDAATLGNKIYAIGGRGREERHDRYMYVYDPAADTWQTKASMPETRFISGVALLKDKIIVITGVDRRSSKESKILVYEPLKDRWHDLGNVPRNFMLAGVASVGDRFYILGGSDLENILFQCLEGTLLSQSEAQDQDGI